MELLDIGRRIVSGQDNFLIFLVLNLAFFSISLFSIFSLIKNNTIRLISSSFGGLIIIFQVCSLYFVHTFIGYSFYVHFNTRDIFSIL